VALELGSAALTLAFALRVVADTSAGLGGLRWLTPLGWAEETSPFADPRPVVLLVPLVAGALLLAAASVISERRDVGIGLLRTRDREPPRLGLLSSVTAQALRGELGSLAGWATGLAAFSLIVGLISTSVSSAGIPERLREQLARLGAGAITTPAGYLSLTFLFFIVVVCAFCCAQIAAARHDEAEQRLETLLALPVSRRGWLVGRLALAAGAAAALSLLTGFCAWAGAEIAGAHLPLWRMLEAGANVLPAATLFLGLAALAFAVVPRMAAGIAYGVLALTFVWQLIGSLLGLPRWLVDLTPFAHIGLVPAYGLRAGAAAAMLGIGIAAAVGAVWRFGRRDLTGA
jgi:ABC-2 type transport system permease protein